MTSTFVVKMEVVEILLLLTLFVCVAECRHVRKHHHSFSHDIHNSLPPTERDRNYDNIKDSTGQIDDDAESFRIFHGLNPKERLFTKDSSENDIALHKKDNKKTHKSEINVHSQKATHNHTTALPKTTESMHRTTTSVSGRTATKHPKSSLNKSHSTSTVPKTKNTSKNPVTHHGAAVTTVPRLEQNKKIRNAIHKKLNNLRLKWAVANLESDLKKVLDIVPDVDDNVQHSSSASTTTAFTGTTTIGVQTTPKPFPGEYQGYIPVTMVDQKAPSSYRLHSGNNQRRRRYIKDKDTNKRAHYKHEGRKHLKKMKILGARTLSIIPNTAELQNHDAITKSLAAMNTNVLMGMLGIKQSLNSLSIHLRKALSTIGDISADNTNEERTDIKVNSDRIAQLQQGLEGKIDDIRYNISNLITTQQELAESMTWSLEKMIGMLSQMVDKVTSNDRKLDDTDKHATTHAPSQEIVKVTNHATTTKHVNPTTSIMNHNTVQKSIPNKLGYTSSDITHSEKTKVNQDVVKRSNEHNIINELKEHHQSKSDVSTHEGNISKQDKKSTGKSNSKQVKSKQKHLHKEKERHSNTNTQHHSVKGKANDSHNRQPRLSQDIKDRMSRYRKHRLSRLRNHRLSRLRNRPHHHARKRSIRSEKSSLN